MVKGKTKRKLVIILSVLLLILFVILMILYHINKLYFLPVGQQSVVYYEEGWNMKFPTDMQVVYTTHGELGFQGDGIRYCVFRCDDGTDVFLKDFIKDKSSRFEEEFRALTIGTEDSENDTALAINVPDKYLPDWTDNYIWKKKEHHGQLDSLYMVFDQKTSQLFVLENSI